MGFPDHFFRKRRALDPEQWQRGDQAECIVSTRWWLLGQVEGSGPQRGETRIVTEVVEQAHVQSGKPCLFLRFDRYPGSMFEARAFRKVRPRADEAIAAESNFTRLIRQQPAPPPRLPEEVD